MRIERFEDVVASTIDFQITDFIPLSAAPEGEIRVRRTCGYVVEDFSL